MSATIQAIGPSQLWKKRLGDWVVNPYVGCEHGCYHCYCPAMPGVKFHNNGHPQKDWGKYIYPKEGFLDALDRQLRNFTPDKAKVTEWGDGWVLMSFLTDCYTPLEAKTKITRTALQLLLEAGHKVRIQTRSALIERDFDILVEHRDRVLVGTSLPFLRDSLARVLEPRATGPTRRLVMLRKAAEAGLQTYVAVAPFMPWDNWRRLQETVLAVSFQLPHREIFCEVLNPKGDNLQMMTAALLDVEEPGEVEFRLERAALRNYDEAVWAHQGAKILRKGHDLFAERGFIPWPDTQRRWAKHLPADDVAWLDQFLPAKEQLAAS
jgi:DNA repair photolyase